MQICLNLNRSRSGLSFQSPDTELVFRDWRIEQNLALWQIICWVSMLGWIGVVLAAWLVPEGKLVSSELPRQITWIAFGVIVPLLCWPLVLIQTRWLISYSNYYGAVALAVIGSMAFVASGPLAASTVGAVGSTMSMSAFALFMRLPPVLAVASISPFVAATLWWVVSNTPSSQFTDMFLGASQILLMSFFVGLISVVSELTFRRGFINEQTIAQQRQLISRYVPPAVAAHISDGRLSEVDLPQRRRVTILFSDIVGFTDMADRLDAESLTQIINEYMAAMSNIVDQHGGTLNEFSGDGLMAVFGAPQDMPPEQQVLQALAAAQEMQTQLPVLNEAWLKLGIGESMKIRVGINTGVLSVGSFGSEGRMTYTAIGLQTNIAARIQAHCEAGGILLSDASWQLVKDQVSCELRGEVECKGVHYPVKVYSLAS